VLSGLTGTRCFVYLDDIVTYARSIDHDIKLREVLGRLRKRRSKLQPDKCEFLRRDKLPRASDYGGRGSTGCSKGNSNSKFSYTHYSQTVTEFCGMVSYYRQFIPDCNKIASPRTSC
jgi:hypothetical protein